MRFSSYGRTQQQDLLRVHRHTVPTSPKHRRVKFNPSIHPSKKRKESPRTEGAIQGRMGGEIEYNLTRGKGGSEGEGREDGFWEGGRTNTGIGTKRER